MTRSATAKKIADRGKKIADRIHMPKKKVTWPQARAFSVHLLTASGSFLAFLSLVAASEQRWTAMFWWLGLALFVDGIDGPIARKLEVKEILPTWSGELLDNIIDYVTYVLIPAFALYQRGLMGEGLSFLSAAIIVVSSAIYYADTGMKTKENFFKGFPVVWNMVVFTLFVIEPGEWVSFAVVVVAGIMTFVPVNFIHPVRVVRLRPINLAMTLLWCGFGGLALAEAALAAWYNEIGLLTERVNWFTKAGITVTGLYLCCIGAVMQLFPTLGAKKDPFRMTKAVRIHANGGPEVLVYEDVDPGKPGTGEVLIRHTAIGLNFLDTYYRSGLYPAPQLPLTPGGEAAGVVLEIGEAVDWLKAGDRVAYTTPLGAYCEQRVIAADKLVKIPDGVTDEQAAAVMLKGLTAEYLLRRTYPVQPGETVLYHAAAGGVGLLFGQWAKHLGVTTIGTAGSAEKVALARQHGFDHVINYSDQDFVAEVATITGGKKCDVVYDSVGKDTFAGSLDCISPRGMLVSFGQSSGPIPPFNLGLLAQKGSLYATRPTLFTYIAKREDLVAAADALFGVIAQGVVKVRIYQRYSLADVAKAHADLESRNTTGTTVLIP